MQITIVSWASSHSRVSSHVPNFKGSLLQLPYKHMEFISWVSAHVGRNRELSLSAHAWMLTRNTTVRVMAKGTHIPHVCTMSSTDDCYSSSDHGQGYSGHLATTQRGERCQSWSEPHLLFHSGLYPELKDAANVCRNPGQLKEKIWCFTSESSWDYCAIPINCSKYLPPLCTYIWISLMLTSI